MDGFDKMSVPLIRCLRNFFAILRKSLIVRSGFGFSEESGMLYWQHTPKSDSILSVVKLDLFNILILLSKIGYMMVSP